MFSNYFKTALRNLIKHWKFSLLNTVGLSIGLAAAFLIFLYISFGLSFDNMHSKSDRIYRIVCDLKTPSETQKRSGPSWAVAPHIQRDFPQVEAAVRISPENILVRNKNIKFRESSAIYADSLFFEIFDFPLIKGNRTTALNQPLSVIFTQSTAKKYFGDQDPVGKTVIVSESGLNAIVTGVMKDIPRNSQIQADMILSMSSMSLINRRMIGIDDAWSNYGNNTYVLLKSGTNETIFAALLPAFLERNSGSKMKALNMYPTLKLERLRDVYLYSEVFDGSGGRIRNIYIFITIGIFIVGISCLNYINLATARAVERAKEIGVRKLLGAFHKNLIIGLMLDSVILCFIALLISVFAVALLIPYFNQLSGMNISSGILENKQSLAFLFIITIILVLGASLYPSLVLSSFKPVDVLKGKFSSGTKGVRLRQLLIVLQYVPTILLIICAIVVYKQNYFMQSQNLGFTKNQIVMLKTNNPIEREALMNSLRQVPGVLSVCSSSSVPGSVNPSALSKIQNNKGEMQSSNLDLYFVDFDFIKEFDLKIIGGRSFSKAYASDTSNAMIINETAARLFGYHNPTEATGRRFEQWGKQGVIVGVMKDFHFMSLQNAIKPLVMRIDPMECNLVSAKIKGNRIQETVNHIGTKWDQTIKEDPFDYSFLDESFAAHYSAEVLFNRLLLYFSIVAISLSATGMLGLTSFVNTQRTKEIGIRKVLGASTLGIVSLISRDFLKLIGIALLIAVPVAWLILQRWLQQFAYRITITWQVFVVSAFLITLFTFLAIIYQVAKLALINPVKSLK